MGWVVGWVGARLIGWRQVGRFVGGAGEHGRARYIDADCDADCQGRKVPCAVASLHKAAPPRPAPCAGPSPPCKVNCDYAVGAAFLYILCEYFARCTEPVAFFATGGAAQLWFEWQWTAPALHMYVVIALLTFGNCVAHAYMLLVLQGAVMHFTLRPSSS